MNKVKFELEFSKHIRDQFVKNNNKLTWHQYVERNMYKLSDEALHYIASGPKDLFFGEWMVKRAVDLTVFEDIVLGDKSGN